MYLHERENWWQFTYDSSKVLKLLGRIRVKQGMVLGSLSTLGFEFQDEAMLLPCLSNWFVLRKLR